MKAELIDFKTGWFGITIGIATSEIEPLIAMLGKLKEGEAGHFHFRSDFAGPGGIGDIEISLKDSGEKDDLKLD